MKTYQQTVRVGELLGPVDWEYDFRSHFNNRCCSDEGKDEACRKAVENLRLVAENPGDYQVTTYGGWPRCGWGDVVHVGMYDGWPYWKPVPSVCFTSVIGANEWATFSFITSIRRKVANDA